jgi:hypothetical protein
VTPFEPVKEVARWRIIYEMLKPAEVNDVITYEQMGAALELHPQRHRHVIQMAMRRAAKEFEKVNKHAVEAVKNVGYRVVQPVEHLHLARKQQKRASRALESGHSKAINVDFNEVDGETRKAFELVARAFAMQMDFNRRLDVRQKRLEDVVETVEARTNRSEEEIAELKRRLARLEEAG